MKSIIGNGLIKCIAFLLLQANALCSCTDISKKIEECAIGHITIDPLDRKIVLTVLFNDSMVATSVFDR